MDAVTYTSDALLSFDTDLDLDEGPDEGPSSAADWMDFVERDQLDDASLDDRRRMLVEDLEEPPISNLCCAAALDDVCDFSLIYSFDRRRMRMQFPLGLR